MIEIKNLTKIYISKLKQSVTAVNNISLTLPSKGLVFLLGESGAGKSTLLNLIGGIERTNRGEICVDGLDIQKSSDCELDRYRNNDVGFIFQDYNLLDNFNVGENIMLAQDLQQHKSQDGKLEKILATVNMSSYAKRKINELSGGQKQRVAIARAIIKNPKIILADEPTGALDFKTGKSILELLKKISENSLVLVVSHDEDFANSFADRIIRIADGEIIEDRTLRDVAEESKQSEQVTKVSTNSKKMYSLSSKTVMKMSTYSLGSKKIRLAITLILCIVCFAIFGIADTLAAWNCEETTYDAIMSSDDKYLVNWTANGNKMGDNYTKLYLRDWVGLNIKERYLPINDNEASYGCYNKYADGFIEIDDNKAKELGIELYAGRYPEKQGEIAISYHIYRSFKAGAYKTDEIYLDGSMIEPTDKENGILGKTLTLDYNYVFTIVGIIDSGYDYAKNSTIDPLSDNYKEKKNYGAVNEPDGHSMIFLPMGGIEYINTLMQTSDYPYGVPSYSRYTFDKDILNELVGNIGIQFVSDLESFKMSGTRILWLGEEKENLADDEIIISYKDIDDLLGNMTYIPGISGNLGQGISLTYVKKVSDNLSLVTEKYNKIDYKFFKAYTNAEIYKYAIQNAELYQDDENVAKIIENYTDGNTDIALAVAYYLSSKGISSEIQTGYLQNPYGKSGLEIIAETNVSLLNEYSIANQFNGAIIKLGDGEELKAKIAGVYIPSEATGVIMKESYGSYFITESKRVLINTIAYKNDKAVLEAKCLVASVGLIKITPENNIKISNAISEYFENDDGSLWTNNDILKQARGIENTMDIMKKIFYYVSLAIGIFASFMFGNYLVNSIMARKKEIGILRAIGATSRDIFHICLFEGMILFAVIFPISSLISGIAGIVINSMVKSDLGIMIPISVFGIRQVALILAVSLAVTLIVSLIGSYVVSKRKPIDVIR